LKPTNFINFEDFGVAVSFSTLSKMLKELMDAGLLYIDFEKDRYVWTKTGEFLDD
jgi:predicted transcriptional regulator